jgi:hypothetical protein
MVMATTPMKIESGNTINIIEPGTRWNRLLPSSSIANQQETGIQDPQQAALYAQQAVALMNEQANNNPQGLHSLFSNFMGGGAAG